MHVSKVIIENFKCFEERFKLDLKAGTNILVGDNEAGKSTFIEAIHLALSGMLNGRYLKNELSQYLFNRAIERAYIASLSTATPMAPPQILIELHLKGSGEPELAQIEGNGNIEDVNASGIQYKIEFNPDYQPEYAILVKNAGIKTIPIEYYRVSWKSFARMEITARGIPIKSALIDSANSRHQNGSDIYISRIIRDNLEDKEKVEISQAHRQMKETFMSVPTIAAINKKINSNADITNKTVTISVDLSTQNAWETSLITYLNDIPFHLIGKGEQSIVKTSLALSHKKAQEANIILLEEPENHLSHSKLNELIKRITKGNIDKQIIMSSHSSYVANKLGLENIIFLHDFKTAKLNELSLDTQSFFKKLPGYDTLRLILCKKAILVEGDSDELVVQRAYRDARGKLPIEDGVDVISVGTSFLRFLEIADKINKQVAVVTDNDGDVSAVEKKYEKYLSSNKKANIDICFDSNVDSGPLKIGEKDYNYNTLEPKLLKANNLKFLNEIFETSYESDDALRKFMQSNKTECALKIFDTAKSVKFPNYILEAIK